MSPQEEAARWFGRVAKRKVRAGHPELAARYARSAARRARLVIEERPREPSPVIRDRALFLAGEAWADGDHEERDRLLDEVEAIEEMAS